ncbi:hypothetical protein [Bradyrhizobium oligotrophicum]|uniref:hypothetical protein n=1 Tax=Bradyrhizobium oligotrophicum TaxID=44255 RepID=UPI0003467D0A|nr:hypothetical protein [Bradyrhizobium oligotrophicum]
MFSSASLAVDVSTSKMPPQQPDRLLDLFYDFLDFGAHVALFRLRLKTPQRQVWQGCSGARRKAQSPRAAPSPVSPA